jgi:integrase
MPPPGQPQNDRQLAGDAAPAASLVLLDLEPLRPLLHQLADLIAERLAQRLAPQQAAVAEPPSRRLLTLDQLVDLLPPGKKPRTWRSWHPHRGRGARPAQARRPALLRPRRDRALAPQLRRPRRTKGRTGCGGARELACRFDATRAHTTPTTGPRALMGRGQILKRPSGSYAIRYHDPAGRRHYETAGRNHRDAEALLAHRLHQHHSQPWRQASHETLHEYATTWLQRRDPSRSADRRDGRHTRTRLAPSTHREYRRALELHILPHLGQLALADLTPAHIDQLIGTLEQQQRAAGTIRNTITPLRKLLGDAHRQGLIASNPAAQADLPPTQEFIGQEIPLEHTQAIRNALVERAHLDLLRPGYRDLLWVCYFDLALGSGLRQGELRALQWQHIDWQKRLLRVEQAYSRQQLRRPKTTAGIRSVPIFPSALEALEQLRQRADRYRIYAPEQLLFQTLTGKPLHASNFNRRHWQPALRTAHLVTEDGKPLYRFHDLRHTCISRLVAAGADIKLIQQIAGHANPMITLKRYSHLLDRRLSDAAQRYDPAASERAA